MGFHEDDHPIDEHPLLVHRFWRPSQRTLETNSISANGSTQRASVLIRICSGTSFVMDPS